MREIEEQISERLRELDPEIELIAAEASGPEGLRLYVDHPDGVDLELCERVTRTLTDLLTRYSLEVSSPGTDRPLTRPEHFRRFTGRQAKVRTSVAIDGRKGFTGTITAANDSAVELALPEGQVTIPLESIHRSNLVPDAA